MNEFIVKLLAFFNGLPEYIQISTYGLFGTLCLTLKDQIMGKPTSLEVYTAILIAYVANILGYYGKLALEKKTASKY